MQSNLDIYLIGLSVLIFLIIVFLFIRKISSGNELKVKIEEVSDSFESGLGGVTPPQQQRDRAGGGSPPHSRSCSNTWPFWAWGGLTPPTVLLKRWGG